MWFFILLVALLDFNFSAAVVAGEAVSSLRLDEFERRDQSEKCPDTAQQLSKLIAEFENIGGELKEATATMNQMASRTEQLTRDLQLHDERLRLHDHHLKKITAKEQLTRDLELHDERLRLHDDHLKKITAKACPSGFDYLPEINGCYKVIFQSLNQAEASAMCQKVMSGVHLAAITSAAEQDAVKRYLQREFNKEVSKACFGPYGPAGKSAWLAGHNSAPGRCDAAFVWRTLPAVEFPLAYSSWNTGEPNGCKAKEDCLHIVEGFQYNWNDVPCGYLSCALCEF